MLVKRKKKMCTRKLLLKINDLRRNGKKFMISNVTNYVTIS